MERYELRVMISSSKTQNNANETSYGFEIESENIEDGIDKATEKLKKLISIGTKKCSMELIIK